MKSMTHFTHMPTKRFAIIGCALLGLLFLVLSTPAQTLINVDFGVGKTSAKTGFAATGQATNDFWNHYHHYAPKFAPGMPLVADGKLDNLKFADGSDSKVNIAVVNAPGVWGNASGDAMFDTFIFAQNGSNLIATVTGLEPGRYHFYLYGHADPDVTGEQNSVFTLRSGTNTLGPLTQLGSTGWKASAGWQERYQYVVFRDVSVVAGKPVVIEVAPGPNGVAVLNGMQIISRGTSPPRLLATAPVTAGAANTNLFFRSIAYAGHVTDNEARFTVSFEVESLATNEISAPLFEGDVALLAAKLPEALRIVSTAGKSRLFCSTPGSYAVSLELVAKITRAEPWNQINFIGPVAPIASVKAEAAEAGIEMQLLSGTQLDPEKKATSRVSGFLGADRVLNLRWQSKTAEITRRSLVTVDTAATAQVTPTVIKFTTALTYEILQAAVPRLAIELPASHTLTRLQGEQIRDWKITPGKNNTALLNVEFIKPVEKNYTITLYSEQPVETTPQTATLIPPQPLEVERESGSFTLSADDAQVEIESAPGLRQVNAPAGSLAAYRFNARPFSVSAKLRRVEPVLKLADRVTARVEESRLLVNHALTLNVEKAGIYMLELAVPTNFVVADVRGEGVDDWKLIKPSPSAFIIKDIPTEKEWFLRTSDKIKVNFASRVLGTRKLEVQLERAHKEFPESVAILPLTVAGATKVTTQLGAASSPGIRLKTQELDGLREVPVNTLQPRSDELLAFTGESADWKLILATEKLSPRIVSDIFNLVTVGDGLVGGSATIRFGIINQGVQEFRVALPAHWKNVEFTGANIRRKESSPGDTNSVVWTLTLQDKAWGGYTLVVTYDYQFDAKAAVLNLAGAHTLGVERETGSLGIMTAASLKLEPAAPAEPLHRVDESELSETDRSLCTRPLLLAYKYTGTNYQHTVRVTRFEELPVLAAVADRTELISVITEEGQMLTQASFMVKNNEMQAQRFTLPKGAELWSTFVNGQPAKPERDGDAILVSLPRDVNRDQAFSVDIVYKQSVDLKSSIFSRRLDLKAPLTDVPNTYAEWALFVPMNKRLSGFDGNMTVARGTTYGLRDAWEECLQFYWRLVERNVGLIIFCLVIGVLAALVIAAARRGMKRAIEIVAVLAILAILAAMLLPALSKAKSKAQRISAINNLKQVGLAARIWSGDNSDRMPSSFEDMKDELGTDKVTIDPNTGQRFVWVGAGKDGSDPSAILAYSPSDQNGRAVLLADGSVQQVNSERFSEMLARDEANQRMRQVQQPRAATQAQAAGEVSMIRPPAAAAMPARPAAGTPTVTFGTSATIDHATGLPAGSPPPSLGLTMPAKPTAAGVRPIRIDVPRSGHQFNFTKVLNVKREPLSISASVISMKTWRGRQMILQVVLFVVGLLMLWRHWSAPQRSSFWLAVAGALMIGGVVSLFAMWRVLGAAFIVLVPVLLFIAVAYCVWQFRRRRNQSHPSEPPVMGGPAATSVTVLLVLLGMFAASVSVRAQDGAASTNSVSLVSASYTGTVQDKVAQFEATFTISSAATNQTLALFNDDIAVQSFTTTGGAKLVRAGRLVSVFLPASGTTTLQMKLLGKLGGDVTKRSLAFAIPPALSSQVNVTIDEAEADVEFPTAVSFRRTASNGQTSVSAILGATDRFELMWTPRVKRAAEIAATVFCQNTALATFSGGVTKLRTTLDYQVTQGELKQLRVKLPAGQRLLRVEGATMRTWELKADTGGEILTVDLLKGVSPGYKLTLETERVLDKLPATVAVEVPHALDVKRETGLVALSGGEELALTVERSAELQRVDAEEFARAAGVAQEGLLSAFRFLRADFDLAVRVEAVQAQIEATIRNDFRVGFEQLSLVAQVNYTVKKAGVFALRFTLPDGWRLEAVNGGNVQQWNERGDVGARVLEVSLKERTLGSGQLQVTLSQNWKEVPSALSLAGVAPLGAQKLSGFVTVTSEVGIGVKTVSFDGLIEVPYASVAGAAGATQQGSALAFKLIGTDAATAGWKLSVATESVEAWVRAEVFNAFTFTETLVSVRALVKFDIANAPVKEFRVRVPAGAKNVELTGVNIRRRDQQTNDWRVELQNKVRGDYVLTVTWEWPKDSRTNLVELAGVEALGVERESGSLVVVARPPLQVTEKSAGDLLSKIDVGELPKWTGRAPESAVLAYRYVRPGYRLLVEARRYAEAEVLQALVDSARLTTVVSDDGQTMTEASLSVRNNGRQHLEIELPKGATVWSAFVAGEPVRPSKREGRLLLPLERTAASEAPITVELTYVGEDKFPRRKGKVALASPKFDVPLKNARWDLFLPPDYEYTDFTGSMTRTVDVGAPTVQDFSRSLYSEAESSKVAEKQKAVLEELSNVKQQLAEGKTREAVGNYNRAKNPAGSKGLFSNLGEVEQLGKEVRRIQGSNLINAQNAWFIENNARLNNGALDVGLNVQTQQRGMPTDGDADVAGKQWEKLEAAQQLAVAKVTPLHVNLPARGVRYSFTQVLQTEINKPMTVGLLAENTKTPSWLGRLGLGATVFALLWVLMSVVARRRD